MIPTSGPPVVPECDGLDGRAVPGEDGHGVAAGRAVVVAVDQPAGAVLEARGRRPLIWNWTRCAMANGRIGVSVTVPSGRSAGGLDRSGRIADRGSHGQDHRRWQ